MSIALLDLLGIYQILVKLTASLKINQKMWKNLFFFYEMQYNKEKKGKKKNHTELNYFFMNDDINK